jgi:RNA polymerase sigma factor (sigma-70 family)
MLLVERRELLTRFRAGQRAALEEVYRHYAPPVAEFLARGFSFASRGRPLRFAGFSQPSDLDNALQETFTRAFKESARLGYDGLHPYKGYLLAVARNFVLDELRTREVAMTPYLEADTTGDALDEGPALSAAAPARATASAEADFLRGELGRLYAEFVAGLDDEERRFFVARFEEQLGQVEAGARAGLSHMQARTREKRLRERFLKHMHKHGYLESYGKARIASVLGILVL